MEQIARFFFFCAGIHQQTLKRCQTEYNKYIGIGATIFFTGLFAALSGGYAMYFVFNGSDFAVFFAFVFGILWGLAIFNMDRYIVSSINKSASTGKQLLQAFPRILLAIMIGIVISRPLELRIFDKEIKERLKISYMNGQRAKIDTLNQSFAQKYQFELNQLLQVKTQRDSLAASIRQQRQQLNFEIFGNKTNETSGRMGYGPYAKRKEVELNQLEQQLDSNNRQLSRMEAFVSDRKQFDGLLAEKLFSAQQLDSLSNRAGFADRNWALGQLKFNPDGTKDNDTGLAIAFIGLLFIFFECLPVFVKLMSSRGPYDYAITYQEEAQIYDSKKEKEAQMEASDLTYEERVHRLAERKRHQFHESAD